MAKIFGDYKIAGEIGKGGQGTIFLLTHPLKKDNFALKMFDDIDTGKNEIKVLEKLTSLHNENIVKCYNFLRDNSIPIQKNTILMEYCSNRSLYDEISSLKQTGDKFPEIQIISWLLQIVNGLEAIHSKNIIHQDIKPQNILISKDGKIKISDFGASRILSSSCDYSREIEGTFRYMSPEAFEKKKVTKMSDIWSLGVVGYELCCLNFPYKQYGSPIAMRIHLLSTYYTPSPIPKMYSKDLQIIIKSMLQKNPANRPTLKILKKRLLMAKAIYLSCLFKENKNLSLKKENLLYFLDHTVDPDFIRKSLGQFIVEEEVLYVDRLGGGKLKKIEKEDLLCCWKSGQKPEMSLYPNILQPQYKTKTEDDSKSIVKTYYLITGPIEGEFTENNLLTAQIIINSEKGIEYNIILKELL